MSPHTPEFVRRQIEASLRPTLQEGEGGTAVVGGLGDRWNGPARQYYESLPSPNAYFTWDQKKALRDWIDAYGPEVKVVGHSWGAHMAAGVVAEGHPVDQLFTLDPVGRRRPDFVAVAENTRSWVNVYAGGGGNSLPNIIARIGGNWGNAPEGYADRHVLAPGGHADVFDALDGMLE